MRLIPALLASSMIALAAPAALAQTNETFHAATYLDVSSASVAQGVDLLKAYRDATRHDPANLEFTILQETGRPNRFLIFESWTSKTALDAYDKSPATTEFQEALKRIRNSPPDRHTLLTHANAAPRTMPADAFYMVEHVDFIGGERAIATSAAQLVASLAETSRTEPGAVRYDIYRQPAPRDNHYEIVSVWTNAQAFDAHEAAAHTLQFRGASAQNQIWRCNLYDQRRFRTL